MEPHERASSNAFKGISETELGPLQAANIVWRILQGVIDDLIITIVDLGVSWAIGVLPSADQFRHADSLSSLTQLLTTYLPLTARLGSIFFIYAAIKFFYYVAFIA